MFRINYKLAKRLWISPPCLNFLKRRLGPSLRLQRVDKSLSTHRPHLKPTMSLAHQSLTSSNSKKGAEFPGP